MNKITNGTNKKNKSETVLLSLGSNLGDRIEYLNNAVKMLYEQNAIENIRVSSFYETEPLGYKNQPWFLNMVISGETNYDMMSLLKICKNIEEILGRQNRSQWHEREIDIDILLFGNKTFTNNVITIPHPRMHERRFVLIPAAEVAADYIHPQLNKTIEQLLEICEDNSKVKEYVIAH